MDRRPLAGWACACPLSAGRQQLAGSGPLFPPVALTVSLAIALNRFCVWL
jgi:hypothetical protein